MAKNAKCGIIPLCILYTSIAPLKKLKRQKFKKYNSAEEQETLIPRYSPRDIQGSLP
jgi:hypothetical protein